MDSSLSITIPCRADEPDLQSMLDSLSAACLSPQLPAGCVRELLICINGVLSDQLCPPLLAVRYFCARNAISMQEIELCTHAEEHAREQLRPSLGADANGQLTCVVLLAAWRGKPKAMNTLWQWAQGELLLFCDADVRVESEAVAHLYARLQQEPSLQLVAAREVPTLEAGASLWSRMGALPYRFNFGNAGGRLFLIRRDAFTSPMPEDLLLEDAWLTVAVGKQYVFKEMRARVFFVLPKTWRDYFAERVRMEGGKIQIRRQHQGLLAQGPIAAYSWSQFLGQIHVREYGLVVLVLGIRCVARLWAWALLRRTNFYALYRPFRSTKSWSSSAQ